jgi:hypothetical protein
MAKRSQGRAKAKARAGKMATNHVKQRAERAWMRGRKKAETT